MKAAAVDYAAEKNCRFEIQQLDPLKKYNLTFFGSHKFSSNDGWHVTDKECVEALNAYEVSIQAGDAHPEALHDDGVIVTLERDPERIAQARGFWERAGVGDRIELVEGDALQTLPALEGSYDLAFVDATKQEYGDYLGMIEPKLTSSALLAVDNVLMEGEVALGEDADTYWSKENLRSARELNQSLMSSATWLTSVLPVGDGVALATRAP